ncbi:NAD(P)-binding protein [Xylaria palmicola]|nr:NAD(P)-binding protein [Xylaria palmicola]
MDLTGFSFVAGGGSGISRAVCKAFAGSGVQGLLIADINLDAATQTGLECAKVAKNPNFRVEAVEMDVVQPSSVENAMDMMIQMFGRVDYCVNGAGVLGEHSDVTELNLEAFRKTIDVNTQGTFLVTRAASTVMATQTPIVLDPALPSRGVSRGSIVNIASIASYITLPKALPYVTSKHAVLGLTKASASDNVKHSIRVNCVSPSWVDTPMIRGIIDQHPPFEQFITSQIPMGRMGLPEEIADVIVFLCSPKSSWINGANIVVDGAMTIGVYSSNPP